MSQTVLLPGDTLPSSDIAAQIIKLGPGLVHSATAPTSKTPALVASAIKTGLLGQVESKSKDGPVNSFWLEGSSHRYIPAVGEPVIGVVIARHAEGYRVDIGTAHHAALDALAFEGATKRSKPNLKIGAVVYARVTLAHAFAEPEIECFDQTTQKAQGFGELTEGMLVRRVELSRCRVLLSNEHSPLPQLGSQFPFEVAVGLNGRVWLKTDEIEKAILLANEIKGSNSTGT